MYMYIPNSGYTCTQYTYPVVGGYKYMHIHVPSSGWLQVHVHIKTMPVHVHAGINLSRELGGTVLYCTILYYTYKLLTTHERCMPNIVL